MSGIASGIGFLLSYDQASFVFIEYLGHGLFGALIGGIVGMIIGTMFGPILNKLEQSKS